MARSEEMNNFNLSSSTVSRGSNKCSISALIGSRNLGVTSAAESSLPTGGLSDWTGPGGRRSRKYGRYNEGKAAADFMYLFIYFIKLVEKYEEFPVFLRRRFFFLFIATYELFSRGWQCSVCVFVHWKGEGRKQGG